jgi:hypothetical protein
MMVLNSEIVVRIEFNDAHRAPSTGPGRGLTFVEYLAGEWGMETAV